MEATEKKVSHTPGPWKAELVTGYNNNLVYCRITSKNFEHPGGIAYTSIPFSGKTKKQKELAGIYASQGEQLAQWNAKLIAAAPDLLKTLQGLTAYFKFMVQDPQFKEYIDAIDAIKKATE